MASYIPSNLVTGQAKLTQRFQSGEMRFRDPVVFKSLLANTPFAMPEIASLRTREDRPVTAYFKNRTSRALGSARTHAPTGAQSDSTAVTPSWATKSDDFFTTLKQGDNNVFERQEMVNHELENSILNFAEGAEDLAANFLFNNRSGVNGVTTDGTFNGTNDVFEISEAALQNQPIEVTKMVMDILKYKGVGLDIYCDSISYRKFKYLRNQGGGNNTNSSYQFTDGNLTFYHAPDMNAEVAALGAGAYSRGFWLAVPKGMVVALDWIPKQNRIGVPMNQTGGSVEYSSIINPIDGLTYAAFKTFTPYDGSGDNGYTQDIKEVYELSIDLSFEKAPLTNAGETVIQAFAFIA